MTVALRSEIQFTATGVSLPPDLSFEEWSDYGERLFAMEHGVMWAIGDWWIYGDHRYGERAAAVLDSRYSFKTFADAGWVARSVESSRRRELLTFSHHKEVAPLPPEEQNYWLDEAEKGRWTRSELRSHIKRGTAEEMPMEDRSLWDQLLGAFENIDTLLSSAATDIAAAVPTYRRATTAKRLRKLGTGLGRIAWSLEGMEATDDGTDSD